MGLILSENVESAENIVNMQYQLNPMNQTRLFPKQNPQSFGSPKIKL